MSLHLRFEVDVFIVFISFKQWKCLSCSDNMTLSPKKSDSVRLNKLLKLVKSLESKLTQQENNFSKKLDETLKSLHNDILENSNLK